MTQTQRPNMPPDMVVKIKADTAGIHIEKMNDQDVLGRFILSVLEGR